MSAIIERFLDLATRPLENRPDLRTEAKGELMARLGHGGESADVSEPVRRLESAGANKGRIWRIGMWLMAAGVAAAAGHFALEIVREVVLFNHLTLVKYSALYGSHYPGHAPMKLRMARNDAPGLVLGTGRFDSRVEELRQLREERPDDLAILQQLWIWEMQLPGSTWTGPTRADEELIADRDPDNALWPLLRSEWRMSQASGSIGHGHLPPIVTISDESAFAEALDEFSKAAGSARYVDHSAALARSQIEAFPPPRSVADDRIRETFAGIPRSKLSNRFVRAMLNTQIARLKSAGDQQGLMLLVMDFQRLCRVITLREFKIEFEAFPNVLLIDQPASSLMTATSNAALWANDPELRKWAGVLNRFARGIGPIDSEVLRQSSARLRGDPSGLAIMAIAGVKLDELKPSRMAEYAVADRA